MLYKNLHFLKNKIQLFSITYKIKLINSGKAITGGTDALGEVTIILEEAGHTVRGHGSDTDIIVASAKAYINALNKLALKNLKG